MIELKEIESDSDCTESISVWSALWYFDFEEAGIERCLAAVVGEKVVGFISVNGDNKCVAIEVHPDFQGKGVARRLCNESGCYRPEYNTNKDFWRAINNNATV